MQNQFKQLENYLYHSSPSLASFVGIFANTAKSLGTAWTKEESRR